MTEDEEGRLLHELGNLLAVIVNYSELIVQALPPGDAVRADASEIERASVRAGEVVVRMSALRRARG